MRLIGRVGIVTLLMLAWASRLHNVFWLATQADEGVHITVARLVAENGLHIYADLFENRTPGVEWLLAGWFRLVGADLFAARVLTLGVITVTVAIAYTLGKRAARALDAPSYVSTLVGLAAATLFSFAPLHLHWSHFVMLEHYSTAAAGVSVLLVNAAQRQSGMSGRSAILWFFAGLAAGLAVIFKQSEIVLVAAMLLYFALIALNDNVRVALRGLGRWSSGFFLTMIFLFGTLALQGAMEPFLHFTLTAGQLAPFQNLEAKGMELLSWTARRPIPWLLLLSLPFHLGSARTQRFKGPSMLLLLWFAAEASFMLLPPVLDLSTGGFSHYIIPVLLPASLLAVTGILSMWRTLIRQRTSRRLVAVAATLLLAIIITPVWLEDMRSAIVDRDYPQATLDEELRIGHAAALLSAPHEPIQVLANAAFYHLAQRQPAGRYFHWPDYLAQSPVGDEAVAAVARALEQTRPPVVLVSRLHFQERLPEALQATLWQHYTPATLFPYAYQRDVLLFLPTPQEAGNGPPLARFEDVAELSAVETRWLDEENLLVSLSWRSLRAQQDDFAVFVHLLNQDGALLAQDDAQPAVGFRPTSTWREGEAVLDYHWISVPMETHLQDGTLSIGLYDPATGERLMTDNKGEQNDAYTQELMAAP